MSDAQFLATFFFGMATGAIGAVVVLAVVGREAELERAAWERTARSMLRRARTWASLYGETRQFVYGVDAFLNDEAAA